MEFCQTIKGSKNLKDPKGSAKRTPAAFTFRICILVFFKGKIICDLRPSVNSKLILQNNLLLSHLFQCVTISRNRDSQSPPPGYVALQARDRIFYFEEAQESIPRNQFRQAVKPGVPVRQAYSNSVPSPHRLFKNSSTVRHPYSYSVPSPHSLFKNSSTD